MKRPPLSAARVVLLDDDDEARGREDEEGEASPSVAATVSCMCRELEECMAAMQARLAEAA